MLTGLISLGERVEEAARLIKEKRTTVSELYRDPWQSSVDQWLMEYEKGLSEAKEP